MKKDLPRIHVVEYMYKKGVQTSIRGKSLCGKMKDFMVVTQNSVRL